MNVKLKVKTNQALDNGQLQTIETFYRGERTEKNGDTFVYYDEFDTVKTSRTTLRISEDKVTIIKFGEVNTKMIFKVGFAHKTMYKTPYGVFDMSMYTYNMSKKLSEKEVEISIDYGIEVDGLMKANNRIEMSITTED